MDTPIKDMAVIKAIEQFTDIVETQISPLELAGHLDALLFEHSRYMLEDNTLIGPRDTTGLHYLRILRNACLGHFTPSEQPFRHLSLKRAAISHKPGDLDAA